MIVFAVTGLAFAGSDAHAANLAVATNPPTILNMAVLLIACAGLIVGVQLLGVLKGGQLSRAWQIFVAGFGVLALCQISILLQTFEILSMPVWVSPALAVLWAGVFFYAVFETRRVLV
jgi:hypothetical protein